MPCYTDPPSRNETATRKAAEHLIFIYGQLEDLNQCEWPAPDWVKRLSRTYEYDERMVPLLCKAIKELTEEERDAILITPRCGRAETWRTGGSLTKSSIRSSGIERERTTSPTSASERLCEECPRKTQRRWGWGANER